MTSSTDPNGFYKRGWLQEKSNTFHYKDTNNLWHSRLLVQNDYAYDNAGQRQSNQISSLDPTTGNPTSRTELYGYDELNRLTSVNYGDGQTQSYTFDQMGSRLTKTDSVNSSESYSVNAANMLTSRTVGGTTSAYTNDANGNTLTGGGRTNTWDSQNRLTKCVNGTNISTFTYGSDGIRHSSMVNGISTDVILDSSMFVRELHNGLVKATYFMGQSGPVYRRDDGNGGIVRWYLYDGLGSVLGEVGPNGNITARRKYDVYGMTRAGSDSGTSKHKFVGSLGHPSDDETSLIYMQARYMDPQTGRFISQDSAGNGVNWFLYANQNPCNSVDRDGKASIDLMMLFAGLADFYAAVMMSPTYRNITALAFISYLSTEAMMVYSAKLAVTTPVLVALYADAAKNGSSTPGVLNNAIGVVLGYKAQLEILMWLWF